MLFGGINYIKSRFSFSCFLKKLICGGMKCKIEHGNERNPKTSKTPSIDMHFSKIKASSNGIFLSHGGRWMLLSQHWFRKLHVLWILAAKSGWKSLFKIWIIKHVRQRGICEERGYFPFLIPLHFRGKLWFPPLSDPIILSFEDALPGLLTHDLKW